MSSPCPHSYYSETACFSLLNSSGISSTERSISLSNAPGREKTQDCFSVFSKALLLMPLHFLNSISHCIYPRWLRGFRLFGPPPSPPPIFKNVFIRSLHIMWSRTTLKIRKVFVFKLLKEINQQLHFSSLNFFLM